ncbi:hypothetical protein BWI97_25595 [Siphonobacter sp. BAB-5405]|nr:hypothetical protein BWI97_25595 [Siphonobacter sp. BAB-5405]
MQRWLAQVSETDVESILLDEKGHVWIGGEGLYDFDPVSRQVIHYDVTDGLQSNSFKVGAAFRGADQTLYWGGANGITFSNHRYLPRTVLLHWCELRDSAFTISM